MAASRVGVALAFAIVPLVATAAIAQDDATTPTIVRVRLVDEVSSVRPNSEALVRSNPQTPTWNTSDFGMAALDGSWSPSTRVRLGGALAVFGDTGSGNVRARVREAYLRVSATDWMDVEGGKRILKWGTGYAFTPTGVLDPPRDPADPLDRLGLTEGVLSGSVHLFRGDTAVSIVGASPDTWRSSPAAMAHRVAAARLRTLVHGVELAFIASTADTTGPSWGINFTDVIGQNFEWHGEALVRRRGSVALPAGLDRDSGRDRDVSALIGCQYTFNVGVNVVLEYYHDGNGLDLDTWRRLTSLASQGNAAGPLAHAPAAAGSVVTLPGLRQFAFLRAAPAAADPTLQPELLAIAGLDDGSLTLVPGLTWTPQTHLQVYARGTVLAGRTGSVTRLAGSKGDLQVGIAARF